MSLARAITISLQARVDLEVNGNSVSVPQTFFVNSIPVTWDDVWFHGVDESGPVASSVHGNVSTDGMWVEEMIFNQYTLVNGLPQYVYSITLKNIPLRGLAITQNGKILGFELSGRDVRKFVDYVLYFPEGPGKYIRTDWNSVETPPSLKLYFELPGQFSEPGPVGN